MRIEDLLNGTYVYLSAGGVYVSVVGVGATPVIDDGYRFPSMGISRVPLRFSNLGNQIYTIESIERTLTPGLSYLGAWTNHLCYYWDNTQGDHIRWWIEPVKDNTILIKNVSWNQYLTPEGDWLTTRYDRYEWTVQPANLS